MQENAGTQSDKQGCSLQNGRRRGHGCEGNGQDIKQTAKELKHCSDQHVSRENLWLKKRGFDAPCHERKDAQTAHTKHHEHLANRNLFGDCFEKGIFNRKSRHGGNHPGNSQ